MTSTRISKAIKMKIYRRTIRPVVMFAIEALCLTRKDCRFLKGSLLDGFRQKEDKTGRILKINKL